MADSSPASCIHFQMTAVEVASAHQLHQVLPIGQAVLLSAPKRIARCFTLLLTFLAFPDYF